MTNHMSAFPRTEDCISNKNKDFDLDGMDLRDWFAGQILANSAMIKASMPNHTAAQAYEIADAMIRARITYE